MEERVAVLESKAAAAKKETERWRGLSKRLYKETLMYLTRINADEKEGGGGDDGGDEGGGGDGGGEEVIDVSEAVK